ncbi:MAG TPA: 23S rRNA (uracil(1939)-C(5))-methyltransferase RlmD, partial [Desulfurivibrionaceae bacterium]|nr:23S rRNA (uracil(1939)-C(5))-methyltransferase RlmD [Desulfurivibrionaceae bacterium]
LMSATHEVVIEKIVAGGQGLARLSDGQTLFVAGTLAGEKVRARIVRRHKHYNEARLVEVVTPSAQRRVPPCQHFAACGGCDLQHAEYAAQLAIKEAILRELLLRAGINGAGESFPLAVVGSPQEFGYRQRIRLQVAPDGRLGFHRGQSHEVVVVQGCPLAAPVITGVMADLGREAAARQLLDHATAVECILSPDEGAVVLLLHAKREVRAADRQQAVALCQASDRVKGILFSVPGKAVGPAITQESGSAGSTDLSPLFIRFTTPSGLAGQALTFTVEPGGFSQVNPQQNERMIATLLDWLALSGSKTVLDLFCGMGNFSLPLALRAQSVVGMDLQGAAIRSAKRNAELNGVTNCRFEKCGAEEGAQKLAATGARFDAVLLDPPRAGCKEVIPHLLGLGAERLVYISCDPATLTRDLALLHEQGYAIERMQLVDMFPQTHHLESMVLLRRG